MAKEKSLIEKLMEMFMKEPAQKEEYVLTDRIKFGLFDNNAIAYYLDNKLVHKFYSRCNVKDGRGVDSRTAKIKSIGIVNNSFVIRYAENNIELKIVIEAKNGDPYFVATGIVKDLKKETETNYIVPLDFSYPDQACNPLFLSLEQKMLLVPYDNDMWVSYEVTPLRPGRTSYDVSAIFNEETKEGIVIGALDFDTWKNAIKCSDHDARVYYAFSGVADEGTHDIYPHGYLNGEEVSSSRFLVGYYGNVMEGLEEYGKKVMENKFRFRWSHANPFGWNSYSAGCMSLEQWEEAGNFINSELKNFHTEDNTKYINLDANFLLNENKMRKIVEEMHAKGIKAGNYMAPLMGLEGMDLISHLKGTITKTYKDVIMKDENGNLYPKIDSGRPTDITNPILEKHIRLTIREMVEMGFDYIKIDFVSHGGVEGKRYDKNVKTGRQALMRFYKILEEELDPDKIGREIFVDFSISPLFPGGYAQGRRSCCDAFGKHEDVKYVLNALNYAWWTSGTLYQYADPDHTTLSLSMVDKRGFTEEVEAKSRYNASVISGTVMLLSDNYGPIGDETVIQRARERALKFANNELLNKVARIGKAFRPLYMKHDACNIFYLNNNGENYVALFNFENKEAEISVKPSQINVKNEGILHNLNEDSKKEYKDSIAVTLKPYDSVIYKIM